MPTKIPDQPVSPPDGDYERNLMLSEVASIIDTLEHLPERLEQVDINPPRFVAETLDYLVSELRAKEGEDEETT